MENLSEDSIKERSDLSHVDGNEPSDVERRSNDDSDCTTKHEQDADMTKDNNYSHVAKTEEIRISGPGNLKIFDDTDTTVNREAQIDHVSGDPIENESDTDKSKYQDNSNVDTEASNTGEIKGSEDGTTEKIGEEDETKQKTDDEDNAKIQENLAKLRQKQTHDEEEDYDYEAYNRAGEKYVYFWKGQDIYSQWHKSWFYVDNKKFNCAEQFMMFKKAELFEDEKIASEVLRCKDPKKMKALGREVRGFDPDVWQQHCLYIVKEGNKAKFMQNQDMLADLLFTYPKLLVEASPYDNIWGIGLDEDSPDAWDINTWQGKNYLGYVITEVRDDIMVEQGMIEEKDREKYIDNLLVAAGYSVDTYKTTNRQAEKEMTSSNTKETPEHNEDKNSSPERAEYHDRKQESYFVFFGGIFSQFYKTFFEVNDVRYNCAEQYMMHQKAVLFNDYGIAKEILKTNNPGEIKRLGREVKGFDNETWQHHCLRLVKEGNMAKFSQNKKLKEAIITTYPKVLVEANQYDKIWGIGLKEDDPKSLNKHTWRGKNFLGYVLTEARDELMYQWHLIKKEERTIYIEKLHELWGTPVDDRSHHKDMNYRDSGAHRGHGRNDHYDRPKNQNYDQDRRNVNNSTGKHGGAFENELQHKKGKMDYGKEKKGNDNWYDGQDTSGKRYPEKRNDDRHTTDRFYHAHGSNQRTNERDRYAKDGYQHQGDKQHANNVPKAQTEYREKKGNGQQTHGSKNCVQNDSNAPWEEVSGKNNKKRNRNKSERSDESSVHKADIEDDRGHAGGTKKPENKAENEKKSNKSDKSGQVPTTDKGNRQVEKGDQPSHSSKSERKTEKQSKRKEEIAIDDFDLDEMIGKLSDKSSDLPSPTKEKENPTGKKSKHPEGSSDHAVQKDGKAKTESVTSDQGGSSNKKGKSRKKRK